MIQKPCNIFSSEFAKMKIQGSVRHVFLCVGPDCCESADGLKTWEMLKKLLKEHDIPALRTKAACLRICSGGPWMLIYPEGIWYGAVTPEKCGRIVEEHLLKNQPVAEWVAQHHPLCGSAD